MNGSEQRVMQNGISKTKGWMIMQKEKCKRKKCFWWDKMILKPMILCFWVRKLPYAFILIFCTFFSGAFLWEDLGSLSFFIIFLLVINIMCSMQKPVLWNEREAKGAMVEVKGKCAANYLVRYYWSLWVHGKDEGKKIRSYSWFLR